MTKNLNSLGFDKEPTNTRVVVGMSGGVDSTVTAALLSKQGYDVIGVTLQLYDHGAAIHRKGACCAGQDIRDAARAAEFLGIPHYVLDYESKFRAQVMDDFADTYLKGATPIPCIRCNQTVKFSDLLNMAKELGADCLATGHYVKRMVNKGNIELHSAIDETRDQSYFLFATTKEQLEYLRFPLGDLPKSRVREMAAEYNLSIADKPDSQDICFVPNGNYAQIVEKLRPGAIDPGEIVHMDGRILGEHRGIIHYTIGQRRGLNIAIGDPLYVVKIDADAKRVYVGPREALATARLTLGDETNWLDSVSLYESAKAGRQVLAKVRSTRPPKMARMQISEGDIVEVAFDDSEEGVAPGQACVLYDASNPTRILGGGFIGDTTPMGFDQAELIT